MKAGGLRYGSEVTTKLPFAGAIVRAKELLKEEGFGVLCEIDVEKTLKEKIGAQFRPYVILGACNPNLAHRALSAENQLGLLLPCNVVVQQDGDRVTVSAIDAKALLQLTGNTALDAEASEVNARLGRVLSALSQLQPR